MLLPRPGIAEISSRSCAGGLAERGVAAVERVGMLLSNRVEFVTTLIAIARLGAIAVFLGTR